LALITSTAARFDLKMDTDEKVIVSTKMKNGLTDGSARFVSGEASRLRSLRVDLLSFLPGAVPLASSPLQCAAG